MPDNIHLARAEVERIVAQYAEALGDDEQAKLDFLEGETGLFELVRDFLARIEDDEGVVAALKEQMEARGSRKARAERRIEASRKAIGDLMRAAKLDKLPLPEAAISRSIYAGRWIVSDVDALPDEYVKTERKPVMEKITTAKKEGKDIPGVIRGNGGESLRLARK